MPHPSPEVMKTLKEIERWQALLLHNSPTQRSVPSFAVQVFLCWRASLLLCTLLWHLKPMLLFLLPSLHSLSLLKQLLCSQPDCRNLPAKPDLLLHKHPTKLCLGDEHPSSRLFSTTQQLDYQPPQQSERVMADSRSHRESHIPFNYHSKAMLLRLLWCQMKPAEFLLALYKGW